MHFCPQLFNLLFGALAQLFGLLASKLPEVQKLTVEPDGWSYMELYIYIYIYMLYIYHITRCVFENKISACIHVQAAMHATLIYANHLIEWHWSHSHTFTFWFYDSVVSWSLLTFLPVPHNVNCWRRALIKIKNHWRTTEPAPPDLCICPMHLKKSPVNDYPAPSRLLWYVHRLLGSYLSLW